MWLQYIASGIVSWKAAIQEQLWYWLLCCFATRCLWYFPTGLGRTIVPAGFCSDSASCCPAKTDTVSYYRRRYVVKHNLITEVYLMTVVETTTCFGLCWPSSGCLGNLRASYMHARARGVEISTYA